MKNLDVRHYLDVYTTRKEMQDKGITQPNELYMEFTKEFVEKLQTYSLDEEIILDENGSFFDSKGNFIIEIPK